MAEDSELLDFQRQSSTATDITLVCDGKHFPAHKMILSATSDYFRAMFSSGWNESKSNLVELPSVGAEEMELIISFLYTGKIKNVDDQPLLQALFVASHFLQIRSLFVYCYKKICEGLNCVSFLETCNMAFLYDDEGMMKLVLTFLAENFEEISKSEEFLKLNEEQMQNICQHPDTLLCSMDVLINGLFRWTEVKKDRENTFLKIFVSLNLKRLSSAFLLENLSRQVMVKKYYYISTLLIGEATRRVVALTLARLKNHNKPKLLTFGINDDQHVVRMYDMEQNQWLAAKTLPFCLEYGMTTVRFEDHVYIVGGVKPNDIKPSAKVIKYCPLTNTIASFGNLAESVSAPGAGVIYEHIYIVNGVNETSQAVTTVQCYNPMTAICEMRARTNKVHTRPHVLPFDKYLIVLGCGENENSIERYDPDCDMWTLITNIPGETDWCSAALYKEKLFVVPIYIISNFQIYDFTTAMWEEIQFPGPPYSIFEVHSVTLDGRCIILVRDDENVLHLFDPAFNEWVKKSDDEPWCPIVTCIV